MKSSSFPSLTSLRAFAFTAEYNSVSLAAEKMNVTQPAVSQQIRVLETQLSAKLIKRHGRGVLLTDDGQMLAQYLQRGFEELRQGVEAISERQSLPRIKITTSPSFATYWLMPRISAFQAAHPEVAVQLDLSAETLVIDIDGYDLAIRFCQMDNLPRDAEPIREVTLNVLCHKSLAPARGCTGSALKQLPWLQELGVSDVKDWFIRQGLENDIPNQISEMPGNLVIPAVLRGEAAAYTVCDWVSENIESGDLVEIWNKPERGCYFALSNRSNPVCKVFMQKLMSEANQPNFRGR